MKAICAILTCVGLLISAVADNPGTQNSRTLLVTADTDEKLLMWQQCGDQAGRWAGKACDAGACVRVNDWFMQCIPTDNSTSVTLVPPNVLQAWEACNAADNPKAVCPQGYTCVRMDEWYSQCRPSQTEVTAGSAPATLQEASAQSGLPAIQAAQLSLWSQCGGFGSCGGHFPCSDTAWTTASCPTGSSCMRSDKWFWQCRPDQTAAAAAAAATGSTRILHSSPGAVSRLGLWQQCGGKGTCGGNSPCADQAWATVACSPGSSCMRKSEWFHQCRPDQPATAAAAAATLTLWAQCGGKGSCSGPNGPCADNAWTKGPQCPLGSSCVRLSAWFWQCKPTSEAASTAGVASPVGVAKQQSGNAAGGSRAAQADAAAAAAAAEP